MNSITYRHALRHEMDAVSDLVLRTFDAYVAPDYGAEGRQTFSQFVQPDALRERFDRGALMLVAQVGDVLAGMIEMRNDEHVTLLFVDGAYQRRGISRELVQRGLAICCRHRPDLRQVSVNSSPYAVEIYKRLGFVPADSPQEQHGIRYIPMLLTIS